MKKLFYFSVFTFLLFTCRDPHEFKQCQSLFNERIGAQISIETANRWVERMKSTEYTGFSRMKLDEPIPSSYLYDYLADIESKLGIAFHYGSDLDGEMHLLIIKYDNETRWSETIFDTKTKLIISNSEAHALCDRFRTLKTSGPWSHFFGKNLIVDILSKSNFISFQLIPGINDEDEQQLLFHVWLDQNPLNGRTLESQLEVYDKGFPCPTNCPNEN
jgi:hypothetical protein